MSLPMPQSDPAPADGPVWMDPNSIRLDGATQPREQPQLALIKEYAEAMEEYEKQKNQGSPVARPFPPIVVFFDGKDYWVADGYQRTKAAKLAGLQVLCDIRPGNKRDAILYSVGANAFHGQRRNNMDKCRSVLRMLNDDKWGKWTNKRIAEQCHVSQDLVRSLRADSINPEAHGNIRETKGKDGTTKLIKVTLPAPKSIIPRPIPSSTEAQRDSAATTLAAFVRQLRIKGGEVDAHFKTPRLGIPVVKVGKTIYLVEPVLTIPAFKEAFTTILLARQDLGGKMKAVIVGHRTDAAGPWIELGGELDVEFFDLD